MIAIVTYQVVDW